MYRRYRIDCIVIVIVIVIMIIYDCIDYTLVGSPFVGAGNLLWDFHDVAFVQLLTFVSILHNDMVFAFVCLRSRRLRFLIRCICVPRPASAVP